MTIGQPTSVIIPSKDRPDFLTRIAIGLATQAGEYHVTVVDNGTDHETSNICARFDWRRVVLPEAGPFSFSHLCNVGVQFAVQTRDVILLNNDVILRPQSLDYLANSHPDWPILGALLINSNGTVNHAGTVFQGTQPLHLGRGDDPARWMFEPCAQVPMCTFAAVRIQRQLYTDLGGLDEDYYFGYEDTDFCLRAAECGAGTGVCRSAVIEHDEFGTRTRDSDDRNAGLFASRWITTGRAVAALQGIVTGDRTYSSESVGPGQRSNG